MKPQGSAGLKRSSPALRSRPASAGPTLSVEQASAKITPARRAAFDILTLVAANQGHSDELLHSARTEALSPEDRNLATALVMGVLRWQIALDARIKTLLQRPDQALAEPVALALRLGAFQLLHMDRIPAHAALSESVEMCRAAGQPYATGMVNAVLRKLAAKQRPGTRVMSSETGESPAAFAERLAHPRWLVERWVNAYGRDDAFAICEADQREPSAGCIFAETVGDVPIMDDGSRLIAELAFAAAPTAGRVWDCCAAPGGKTLILARNYARNSRDTGLPAPEIMATDISPKRLARTQARFLRFAYADGIRSAVADATAPKPDDPGFDLILCDVPCTGTGTLAANPEIRHRLKPEDLPRQAERQRALLQTALSRLAPGGRLVYSTCSLEPDENEEVVDAVLSKADFRSIPVAPLLESLQASGTLLPTANLSSTLRGGVLRTLPDSDWSGGFFAAVIERAI